MTSLPVVLHGDRSVVPEYNGYVYYQVVKYWPAKNSAGFVVWKYLLRRDDPVCLCIYKRTCYGLLCIHTGMSPMDPGNQPLSHHSYVNIHLI